jgi:hypothetical protein
MVINFELWTILTALAAIVAAVAAVKILSRLSRILEVLERTSAAIDDLRASLGGVSTIIRNQEETIEVDREEHESKAAATLLGEEKNG